MTDTYRLYGGDISYYTGKARAYLRYKDVPFEERVADRAVYKEIIVPRVGWPVIPVVITPEDETLQDTTDIIDALEQRFPEPAVYPEGPRQHLVALLLECFGDEWLKIPAMHYRWNHNTDWIIREFGRLSRPDLSAEEQYEVGERTCRPFRGSLPALGVTAATIPAVEASYEALLGELDAHFAVHPYLLGTRPSIGDFGLFGPLYAHQYRDPASGALMERLAPNLVAWVKRMHEPAAEDRVRGGEFLADDAIPDTLLPVLRRMTDEYFPVLAATRTAFEAWAQAHPDEEVPRAIGMQPFTLGRGTPQEAQGERAIFPFDLWMFQRPQRYLAGLEGAQRTAAEALLTAIDGLDVLSMPIGTPLARVNFRLQRAPAASA
ncbi:MAG TPA: glutathione S-transferase family protein [Pseudomonadales bacterium]|nr:glutathione S-transferase family protein [Pseudomonadales bacterium]